MNQKAYWIIRLGLAFVFIWFGIDKFIAPINWIGYVPGWLVGVLPMSLEQFMYINGVIEILLGLGLLYKKTVRVAAAIIIVFLVAVTTNLGFNEVAVRDIALIFMAVSLVVWNK